MKKTIAIILCAFTLFANAQRQLSGTNRSLLLNGKVFLTRGDSTGTPTGGCLFRVPGTTQIMLTPCGSGGGSSYSFANGLTNTSGTVTLGDLLMTGDVSFDFASGRHNWTINDGNTLILDFLHAQVYREFRIENSGTCILGFGPFGFGTDVELNYDGSTLLFTENLVSGVCKVNKSSGAEYMRTDPSGNLLIGKTAATNGAKVQIADSLSVDKINTGSAIDSIAVIHKGVLNKVLRSSVGGIDSTTADRIARRIAHDSLSSFADLFTPSATATSNISSLTPTSGSYVFTRVGKMVEVTAKIGYTCTSSNTMSFFHVAFPTGSGSTSFVIGVCSITDGTNCLAGSVDSYNFGEAASIGFNCGSITTGFAYIKFSYQHVDP